MSKTKIIIFTGCIFLFMTILAIALAFFAAKDSSIQVETTSEMLRIGSVQELEVLSVDWEVWNVVDNVVYVYPSTGTYVVNLNDSEIRKSNGKTSVVLPPVEIEVNIKDDEREVLFEPDDWWTSEVKGSAEDGLDKFMAARQDTEQRLLNDMVQYADLNQMAEDNAKIIISSFLEDVSVDGSLSRDRVEIDFRD